MDKNKGFGLGGKTTSYKPKSIPRLIAQPGAGLKRLVIPPLAPQFKVSASGAVPARSRYRRWKSAAAEPRRSESAGRA